MFRIHIVLALIMATLLTTTTTSAESVAVWVGEAAEFKCDSGQCPESYQPDLVAKLRRYGFPVSSLQYQTKESLYTSSDTCPAEVNHHFTSLETFTEPFRGEDAVCAVNVYKQRNTFFFAVTCWDNEVGLEAGVATDGITRAILEVPVHPEESFTTTLTVRPSDGSTCRYRTEAHLVRINEDDVAGMLDPTDEDPLVGL